MISFLVPYLFIVLNHLNINNVPMNEFELPKTWTKDFTITYSFSTTKFKFSYDSCIYTIQPGISVPQTGVFAMTDPDRTEILKMMHELKVNTIKSKKTIAAVSDGWEKSLHFGVYVIEAGTSYTMSDTHKEIFSNACEYLHGFVLMKRSKTK
ncbi:hypothetical protein FAM09_10230 [Niastella caeni]|uniref:Uncharacterized protein n=1 Tax=Niastella caeni TaxID=2569763 RepID=A0A4S8HX41_9BACT|nr:hypothetical protein [Niastella caeni]THU40237.1 hypothetical protein FAM09_10230 [Niastella caeni]